MLEKQCNICKDNFEIKDSHLAFYDKVSPIFDTIKYQIPTPTLCPDCRLQRRMAFSSYWFVTKRKSSYSGKMIFSMYPDGTKFPIYENEEWYSDHWNALSYGRDFDFNRGFFEQFFELRDCVPHRAVITKGVENSDYCNNSIQLKDCYLAFGSVASQGCMYCDGATACKDCIDCTGAAYSELCYGCISCRNCYNTQESINCLSCIDSIFLLNCISCTNCLGCVNLRHKNYYIFNQEYSKEEYFEIIKGMNLSSYSERQEIKEKALKFFHENPQPHWQVNLAENATGDYIFESKNVENSFFISKSENIHFGYGVIENLHDSYDATRVALSGALLYEILLCGMGIFELLFCYECVENCKNLIYCALCHGCTNCFACVGLQKKNNCIFNKQYSKEEYEKLVPKIIQYMEKTNEWGEFFPAKYSAVPYNLTIAHYYFPLTESLAKKRSLAWHDEKKLQLTTSEAIHQYIERLPETDESICYKSELSGNIFRIISHELKQYRKLKVPLPRKNHIERFFERMLMRGNVKLYQRKCAKSGKDILTTYSPDSPWIIWDKEEFDKFYN